MVGAASAGVDDCTATAGVGLDVETTVGGDAGLGGGSGEIRTGSLAIATTLNTCFGGIGTAGGNGDGAVEGAGVMVTSDAVATTSRAGMDFVGINVAYGCTIVLPCDDSRDNTTAGLAGSVTLEIRGAAEAESLPASIGTNCRK